MQWHSIDIVASDFGASLQLPTNAVGARGVVSFVSLAVMSCL